MDNSILRILGRITLILAAAAVVVGLAYGFSSITGSSARFRPGDNQRFTPPSSGSNNQSGQFSRQPRGDEGEGFRENGSLIAGLVQVLTKAVIIGVFTWLGLLALGLMKRKPPQASQDQQVEPL